MATLLNWRERCVPQTLHSIMPPHNSKAVNEQYSVTKSFASGEKNFEIILKRVLGIRLSWLKIGKLTFLEALSPLWLICVRLKANSLTAKYILLVRITLAAPPWVYCIDALKEGEKQKAKNDLYAGQADVYISEFRMW